MDNVRLLILRAEPRDIALTELDRVVVVEGESRVAIAEDPIRTLFAS